MIEQGRGERVNERLTATVPPSRGSIMGMVVLTFLVIYGTFWAAMTGEVFDGRNLVGFLVGLVASVVMIANTAGRIHRRLEVLDARRELLIEQRIQAARERALAEHDDEVDSDV